MTKPILIAAALLSAAASPVLAHDVRPAASPSAESSGQAPAKRETRYCIVQSFTGSYIPQKICKTRADWQRQYNFDPLAKD